MNLQDKSRWLPVVPVAWGGRLLYNWLVAGRMWRLDTEMAQVVPADLVAKAVETTPLRRIGQPEEIAELA